MSQILVTGGSGFIGSNIVRSLNKRGIYPKVLVRSTSNLFNLEKLNAEIIICDLLNKSGLEKILEGCDIIFHAAGYISSCKGDKEKIVQINFDGTKNLIEASLKHNIKKYVFISSVTAIGGSENQEIFKIGNPYNLGSHGSAYSIAKRRTEVELIKRIQEGLPIIRVYPSLCIGPGDVNLSSSRVITEFYKGRLPFITNSGTGIVDVRDAAEAIVLAMEKGEIGKQYFVSGHNVTYQQFYNLCAKLTNHPPPKYILPKSLLFILCEIGELITNGNYLSRSLYMVFSRYFWYDNSDVEKNFGWKYRSLETTILDSINWLKQVHYI